MNDLTKGTDVCITLTLLDGLVLARSTFHHSMNYRSVVVFGHSSVIEDPQEKNAALEHLVEHLVPGRGAEARGASEGELAATLVVEVPIAEASAKVRTGPPVDETKDLEIDIWAGVLPLRSRRASPSRTSTPLGTSLCQITCAIIRKGARDHQFPTGATMPLARRLKLLAWAEAHNSLVLEDDYDSEYRYEGRPLEAIQSLDGAGRVLYIGTFSKVLFPALRLGFLVLPPALVPAFTRAKWLADRHAPSLEQTALA